MSKALTYYQIINRSLLALLPIGASPLVLQGWRLLPFFKPEKAKAIETSLGFSIIVDPVKDKGVERFIYCFGSYEQGIISMMSAMLRPGDTFVDVGANIGFMSLHASRIVGDKGRVISFEAMPSTFNILSENVKLNHRTNLTLEQKALGSVPQQIQIFENMHLNRGSSSLLQNEKSGEAHSVELLCLDSYLTANNIDDVHCIKIDVEGWELEVLKGSRGLFSGPKAPQCIIECSAIHQMEGGTHADLFSFFKEVNTYRIFKLKGGKERGRKLLEIKSLESLPTHDNLFCLLDTHIQALPKESFSGGV